MLDYKLVEALAVVVAEGGFEKAGRVLGLTQSAVSQRIRLLEELAGCVLLVRASPPRPTDAGRGMLTLYRQVHHLEEGLSARLGLESSGFATLAVGINVDSLATWFFPVVDGFLDSEPVLLDLRVDDQAQTHALLRNGEVLGCISDRAEPMQGCSVHVLGEMHYRLYGTPAYQSRWFASGVTREGVERAPMLIFNRKDVMHAALLAQALGSEPSGYTPFYLPSSEQFAPAIGSGRVCGMLPDEQAHGPVGRGELVDLLPGHAFTVSLHWHCWNLETSVLTRFTRALVAGARRVLAEPHRVLVGSKAQASG
ncbi:MAG: LysR family transcriptional regulator ArgP [Proteobacteria bacterium]|nr:LysR family transcriptional regulator ArgP [Pseudomonadota bacterium]